MEGTSYSLADIRAATDHDGYGYGDGMWGGNGIWFLALLFLFGGGGFGWNRNGSPVTEADLCSSQSFSELKSQVGRLNDSQAAIARQTDNAICQLGYQALQNTNAIQSQLASCCCDNLRAADSIKFDMANYAAATNAAITANTQKVLDKMAADKEAALNARIQSLELQQAMCGVVRYPTATTYATNCNPFFGYSGCGCTNI